MKPAHAHGSTCKRRDLPLVPVLQDASRLVPEKSLRMGSTLQVPQQDHRHDHHFPHRPLHGTNTHLQILHRERDLIRVTWVTHNLHRSDVLFWFFPQITLADYSLSDAAFDKLEDYKNMLAHVTGFCNHTEPLDSVIPQLEEFIDVARSELVCTPLKLPAAFMICAPLIQSASWNVEFTDLT